MKAVALFVVLATLICAPGRVAAQPYPNRIIKLVVPFPAGGGADVLARILTRSMSEDLGQSFLIQNQPGAGGAIAFEQVARAAPDGYTLVWTSAGFAVMSVTLSNLAFKPESDFIHIVHIAQNPFVLVVNPQVPANSVRELIDLANAKPNTINFAHNGGGTLTSLAIELLKLKTSIAVGQVGYRGDNFSISDVVAGHVQAMFSNSPVSLPHIREGRLRGLAVTSPKRSPAAPDLPTTPSGTPRPIVDRVNASVRRALQAPEMVAHFRDFGAEPVGSTPEEFDAFVRRQLDVWSDVVKRSGQAK